MKPIHIIGRKNSGKTTLIVQLVKHLCASGYLVGTVKHTHHHHELDTPGKDSFRHRTAGTVATAIVSPGTTAVFWSTDPNQPSSARYDELSEIFAPCDVVLVEGDVRATGLKIEVWRASISDVPLASTDTSIRALITDDDVQVNLPIWSRSDVAALAKRLIELLAMMARAVRNRTFFLQGRCRP